ncbi:MATE family efflux transporter [Brumicola blandensis]|jgi:MATE family multidrug resistance protein|uniref:MATE family efflux transporter n=1 Tax=Brumicola blandensis TaxID=3075611 RepID=A0AAW8R5I1_9ALTE|nr:MATE family efflux transporter [Alteromonas sp. W409]MDT0583709.1 MATE family efflux transporter [Alteromonas sp. W409]
MPKNVKPNGQSKVAQDNANRSHPWQLLILAVPLILANITTPLLGLVDTAILGHMNEAAYLAGASIGTLILTQLYWICGFIKMSVTGLSAQSAGGQDKADEARLKVLIQGITLGLVLGLIFVVLQSPILSAGLYFAQSSDEFALSTQAYFSVRVWGAPAALINLALVGWLIGQQKTRTILLLQVVVNLINIVFSVLFVFGFGWGIEGVAAATVLAEYSLLACSLYAALRIVNLNLYQAAWLKFSALKALLNLNTNILFRNLALQFTLAFVTFTGATLGTQTAATNAILMQFFALIALGLDGVANAVEALVGEQKGRRNLSMLKRQVNTGLFWSSIFSLVYAIVFWLFGSDIINLLTDQLSLRENAKSYLGLMIALPLIAHWCFLFDGVFVGLTHGRAMRDSMILSAAVGFFAVWWMVSTLIQGSDAYAGMENYGLWLALLSFLASRGLILGLWYGYLLRKPDERLWI